MAANPVLCVSAPPRRTRRQPRTSTDQLGGALGLAVLASLAASRTEGLLEAGREPVVALNAGFHAAFLLGAVLDALAAVLAATLLRLPKAGAKADSGGPKVAPAKEREAGGEPDAWTRKG